MNTTFKFFEALKDLTNPYTTSYNQLTHNFLRRLLETENRRIFKYLVRLDLI